MTREEALMTARTRMVDPTHFIVITVSEDGKMIDTHSCTLVHLLAAKDLLERAISSMVYGGAV